jgi:hypothetical protein
MSDRVVGPLRPIGRGDQQDPLDRACQVHLDFLRKNCPHLLPAGPLDAGAVSDPLPIEPKRATTLVTVAVQQAVATSLADGDRRRRGLLPAAVVWTHGADSLLVLLDSLQVTTDDGLVTVGVDVACDEVVDPNGNPRSHVEVDLVVGTAARPTGLLVAAPTPRGPDLIVQRWGDALVSLAWQGVLDAAAGVTAAAGHDVDGNALVPTTWTASSAGLQVGPQARHPFDRRPATATL